METNNVELITRMVLDALNKKEEKGNGFMVPIGVSARHIHLTQEHVEALFGPEYQLTKKKELMGGQFASNETVTIVGLKLRAIENVRILGPVRKASQVEVSATDAIKLGMKVPVRESGDVKGSAPIAIVGPKGAIYLKEGCIVAMRHIHMSPKDAQAAGVKDEQIILDPGVGFGKTYEQNLEAINHVDVLQELGLPILLGTSRKSVIGNTLDLPVDQRVEGTLATTVIGMLRGCSFVRVHDIKENHRIIQMTKAILSC